MGSVSLGCILFSCSPEDALEDESTLPLRLGQAFIAHEAKKIHQLKQESRSSSKALYDLDNK
eukprot:2397825-Amphidinium_carterae.1